VAAPIVAVVVGLLTGATIPAGALLPHAGAVIAVDGLARQVYVDLPAICAATDGPLDRLGDLADAGGAPGSLARRAADSLARAADAACAAAQEPNTPINRLAVAVAAVEAIVKANEVAPAPITPAASRSR